MITLIPPLERYPRVVDLARSGLGRLLLVAAFAGGLILHGKTWWLDAGAVLLLMSFLPTWRRQVLLAAMLWWLWQYTPFNWQLIARLARDGDVYASLNWPVFQWSVIAAALLFCAAFYQMALRFRESLAFRRPLRTLLIVYIGLLALATWTPLPPLAGLSLWAFLIVLGRYIWFLAYSLLDLHSKTRSPFTLQLGHYHPFWMGVTTSPVPFGKGAAYLRKIEAKDAGELAVTQLKGLKLLAWALVLVAIRAIYRGFVYTGTVELGGFEFALPLTFDLPGFQTVFRQSLAGNAAPWHLNWLALIARFLLDLLSIAIWGHVMIATCRMAGFRALRNTYRPLRSATIAEFWNRYYYYFKELMVECFFYPAYLRYFKRWPRLRLLFATMAAAGFGNVLYHFLRDGSYIARLGLWDALVAFRVYLFYGALLGLAIGLSQLRHRNRRIKRDSLRTQILAPLAVLSFYCVLSVFDDPDRSVPALEYFRFVLHLVPGM